MPSPKSGKAGKAVPPAAPEKAEEADIADPGKMAKIKAEQMETKTGKYGSEKVKPFIPPPPEEEEVKGIEEGKDEAEEEKEEEKKKTWIEIELLDERNEPIPGEKYRITVPEGRVAEGTLNENGWARVEGFERGECEITFPNLDKDTWDFKENSGPKGEE